MSRVKEVDPLSSDIPEYKSHPSRIVISQREAYNNLRQKVKELRSRIKYYQIRERDLELSRDKWKTENQNLKIELEELKKKVN